MSGFHIDKGGFLYAAAIDARHRTYPCWHDMAAGISITREKPSIPLRVYGKVVILQCRWPVNRAGRKIDPTSILAEIATKNKAPIF